MKVNKIAAFVMGLFVGFAMASVLPFVGIFILPAPLAGFALGTLLAIIA